MILKVVAETYDDRILHESDEFEKWQWLDAVPFIEEYNDGDK